MSVSEKQLDEGVQKVLVQILKAAKDYHNNPDRAEEYIIRKVNAIYTCGKEIGRSVALNELFNGDPE